MPAACCRTSAALAALFLAFAAPLAPAARAATTDGQFATRGAGALTCGDLVGLLDAKDRPAERDQFTAWIAGYLSHANRATSGAFDVMAIQDNYVIAGMTARVCRDNPTALVETALHAMVSQMAPGRATSVSELVSVEADGRQVVLRAEVMALVQARLVAQGQLAADAADGKFGPKTRNALLSFQKTAGVTETGLPDGVTLFRLFKAE